MMHAEFMGQVVTACVHVVLPMCNFAVHVMCKGQKSSCRTSFLVKGDGIYFTTFGISGGIPHTKSSQGHPLGILSGSNLSDTLQLSNTVSTQYC